jgi:3'(2'), 5'-bisphosphate nucleotidase
MGGTLDHARLLEKLIPIVRRAGEEILEVYCTDFEVREKADASPVTCADERSEAVLIAGLRELAPDIVLVSEEAVEGKSQPHLGRRFWLVDPLDGTREFASRNGEFTVNVAMIEDGLPVLGIVFAPAMDRLYYGAAGLGAFLEDPHGRKPITVAASCVDGVIVVSSRSHREEVAERRILSQCNVANHVRIGSSLKFCLVASGEAHLYPRCGPTMEWDTAAGQAVLVAAGGEVTDLDGAVLSYGKQGLTNPGFLAFAPGAASVAVPRVPERG